MIDTGQHMADQMDEIGRWEPSAEQAEHRDALDHIMRVALASRDQTRRIKWIAQRAKSAVMKYSGWGVAYDD